MIPWVHLDTAEVPGSAQPLRLMQRGNEFSIMAGTNGLMNSRLSGSEEALATLTAEKIAGRYRPRVLIGGLGMGFTLRAALSALPSDAEIIVAELVPAIIAWARGPLSGVFAGALDDPRVTLVEGDVGARIATAAGAWDAILLDVDNGPEGLTTPGNDTLYATAGLARAFRALKPGGVLSVWSAHPDDAYTRRLKAARFAVEEVRVRARVKRGARHVIWFAIRPA